MGGNAYSLSVQKFSDRQDEFKVKISRKPKNVSSSILAEQDRKKCSFLANFANHSITNERNLFAPFLLGKTTFGDSSSPDCLLWSIPDFGLLKLARDGSVFFGHEQDQAPLLHHDITFKTPGKLFLQFLRAATLSLQSPETELCGAIVTDFLFADHLVRNSGGLKVHDIYGIGKLLNEGVLELEGTRLAPAKLGVKTLKNKKRLQELAATIKGSYVQVTGHNESFVNGENAPIDIAGTITVDPTQRAVVSAFSNKGVLKSGHIHLGRSALNEGLWQTGTMAAQQPFKNKEFGQLKIMDGISLSSSLVNEGECEVGNIVGDACSLSNKGSLVCQRGNIALTKAKFDNAGSCVMDKMTSSQPFDITNDGALELKNSTLSFDTLQSNKDLVLRNGIYTVGSLLSKRLQLLENNWNNTHHTDSTAPHRLVIGSGRSSTFGNIDAQKDVIYDTVLEPASLHVQGDITCSQRNSHALSFLQKLQTPGKVTAWVGAISLLKPKADAQPSNSLLSFLLQHLVMGHKMWIFLILAILNCLLMEHFSLICF